MESALAIAIASALLQGMLVFGQVSVPKNLPPQSTFVDPHSFAVLGANGPFRTSSTTDNPPFFQIFDPSFLEIIGPNPTFTEVASNATFAFAHEAPIFNTAMMGGALGMSDLNHNNKYGKISIAAVQAALQGLKKNTGQAVNVPITELNLPDSIQMTNGGTGPLHGNLVLINSGRGPLPPSIALVNPKPPNNVTVLLDNFFGRQFNSLNDIKIHPISGALFFTDVTYGFINAFRPPPLLPNQVYRLDPVTSAVRVVATDFDKCNGIAFSPDGKLAYIADTGALGGVLFQNNQTEPTTLYEFDVDPKSQRFLNRRVFAYIDTGAPDGVQVDARGNVYAACGDGVHVWSPEGVLLGKFFIGSVSSNFIFAGDGQLVILAETKIFFAKIAAKEGKVAFP
ncbi:D-lactonohydrolase-like protein [Gymnopilus junonius]|uniref:D-lactonohydrolase-like protein n=1 Tax=Gymnopilus junonius TaxID=109634 RepID=A0A9P5NQ11_GYMJU|nr:D-lactonohydrolase-like protein [Gymnopilus junonius]